MSYRPTRRNLVAGALGGVAAWSLARSTKPTGIYTVAGTRPAAGISGSKEQGVLDGNDPSWGFNANGVDNDTPAFQAILNAAATSKQKVILPAGTLRLFDTVYAPPGPSYDIGGEGPERTVITPPATATALAVGDVNTSSDAGLYIHDMTFRHNSYTGTDQPILDIIQYGRPWSLSRVHFDGAYSNRTALRLYSSWCAEINACYFWKFGQQGQAGQRGSVIIKAENLPATNNGPINNVAFNSCAWEGVQAGVQLHDPNATAAEGYIYSVLMNNPRFKNSSKDGYVKNSTGVEGFGNTIFGVVMNAPFFEDYETGVIVRGHSWKINSPYFQSADVCIRLATGKAHLIEGMVLDGRTGNEIGIGVLADPEVSGICEVRRWESITGGAYLTSAIVDNTGGKVVDSAA